MSYIMYYVHKNVSRKCAALHGMLCIQYKVKENEISFCFSKFKMLPKKLQD